MSGITNSRIFVISLTSSWGNALPSSAVLPAARNNTGTLAIYDPFIFYGAGEWHCVLFVYHYLKEAWMMSIFCGLKELQKPWYLSARGSCLSLSVKMGKNPWSSTNVNAAGKRLPATQPARFQSGNISQMGINSLIQSQNKKKEALWYSSYEEGMVFSWNIWKWAVPCPPSPLVKRVPVETLFHGFGVVRQTITVC